LRLSKFFGNSPQFWLGLQDDYDLEEEKNKIYKELNGIHKFENRQDYEFCFQGDP